MKHEDCGLGDGTHFACECTLRRLAELEAEVARLRTGLTIAESFVRTATAEVTEARAVLAEVQWDLDDRCPWPACDRLEHEGHAPGCRLAALLQG